jgi:DNA polymerase-3 subunit alpha
LSEAFVHLHTHSEYSILDSSCKIPALLDRVAACGMDALALTDHGVMCGVIKFYREAKRRGIKPIVGSEVYVAPGDRRDRKTQEGERYHHLLLLARDREGYQNLIRLVSLGHTEGFYYKPRVDWDLLKRYHGGLVALSGCESGRVSRLLLAGREKEAAAVASEHALLFGEGSFYIEIQDHGTEHGKRLRERLVRLARSLGLPLAATNDIHYLVPEDRLAHEVILNIRSNKKLADPDRMTFDGDGYHFRSAREMEDLFSDLPDALENTRRIADSCSLELEFGVNLVPPFALPAGMATADEYLSELAHAGTKDRYGDVTGPVKERLDYELSVIERMNYATYFLIVWDFVRFARESNIPVGPGRGSAAGSLVSYALGITRVDPLKYNLIFERFLNPDRISMPDFDIDFCVNGRDRVIAYVREKYGGEGSGAKTAQIATFDRMAARSVVRDVGRVLGTPYGKTDRLAKLIPYGYQLETAVAQVPELAALYETDEEVKRIVDIGRRLEGLTRSAATHAAGVVISAEELVQRVPLMRLTTGEVVTQFDMGDIEAVGLLKFDFLGLRNLTLIAETITCLQERAGIAIDLDAIPLDDEKTFRLVQEGRTAGIFQLEGSGVTGLIRQVKPHRFEDLVALLALYRPGPLESGMTDDYVRRRSGRVPITYPHPSLKEVLEDTYGLPIYQDQVMLIAQKLAGFTLAEADTLRKAMGKKKKEIMDSLREKFIAGCRGNGLAKDSAERTFGDLEKFARYGFNKSHATAYAFVSYWTAYLKANYPTHFMASLLGSVQGDTDKVAEYIGECHEMGIEVLPPDINESERDFTPVGERRIRFGLGAIKHVGDGAIASILAARDKGFASFFDLCRRINGEGVDREALEALIKAGTFDGLGATRRGLLLRLSEGLERMQVARAERESGQVSFFDGLEEVPVEPTFVKEEFAKEDLLTFEKELLGLYVSAHPLDRHRERLSLFCTPLSEVTSLEEGSGATVGGRVKRLRKIPTKNGAQMAFLTLEDGSEEVEVTVFPKLLEAAFGLLSEDRLLGLRLTAGDRNGKQNLIAEEIFPLDEISSHVRLSVIVTLAQGEVDRERLGKLVTLLQEHRGDSPVLLRLEDEGGAFEVAAGKGCAVTPSQDLKEKVEALLGPGRVLFQNAVRR